MVASWRARGAYMSVNNKCFGFFLLLLEGEGVLIYLNPFKYRMTSWAPPPCALMFSFLSLNTILS